MTAKPNIMSTTPSPPAPESSNLATTDLLSLADALVVGFADLLAHGSVATGLDERLAAHVHLLLRHLRVRHLCNAEFHKE